MNGKIIGLSGFFFTISKEEKEKKTTKYVCEMLMDKRTRDRFTNSSVCFSFVLFFRLFAFFIFFLFLLVRFRRYIAIAQDALRCIQTQIKLLKNKEKRESVRGLNLHVEEAHNFACSRVRSVIAREWAPESLKCMRVPGGKRIGRRWVDERQIRTRGSGRWKHDTEQITFEFLIKETKKQKNETKPKR